MRYQLYGREISEPYDWVNDPKHYKVDHHIPFNRCYHCGIRFLNSKYAAYCNACDNEMSPDADSKMFVVTAYDPQAKPPIREGYWTTRRQIVRNRIRIPDDVSEEEYDQKIKAIEKVDAERPLFLRPNFETAMDEAKKRENE